MLNYRYEFFSLSLQPASKLSVCGISWKVDAREARERRRESQRGFASRSRVFSCLASLAQIRELARRLPYSLQQNKVTDITRIRRDRNLNKWLCERYVPLVSIWLLLGYLWHNNSSRGKKTKWRTLTQRRCVSRPPAIGAIICLLRD